MNKIQLKKIHDDGTIKVLLRQGAKGSALKPHIANQNSHFILIKGEVILQILDTIHTLKEGDYQLIPTNRIHHLKLKKSSQFYLIHPSKTTMTFPPS